MNPIKMLKSVIAAVVWIFANRGDVNPPRFAGVDVKFGRLEVVVIERNSLLAYHIFDTNDAVSFFLASFAVRTVVLDSIPDALLSHRLRSELNDRGIRTFLAAYRRRSGSSTPSWAPASVTVDRTASIDDAIFFIDRDAAGGCHMAKTLQQLHAKNMSRQYVTAGNERYFAWHETGECGLIHATAYALLAASAPSAT